MEEEAEALTEEAGVAASVEAGAALTEEAEVVADSEEEVAAVVAAVGSEVSGRHYRETVDLILAFRISGFYIVLLISFEEGCKF